MHLHNPFRTNRAHFIFLQKCNPRLQPGQKSKVGWGGEETRQKRFHFNLTLTVLTEETPTQNTNGNEPTRVRRKGTLGCGFFFRAGGNHFRGDGERGGSAVFRRHLSLGGPREAPEAGGPGRDGGSGVRGRSRSGPREAVSAGAAELLHLQPALRAARGRGKWSGGARGRPWAAEGPGLGGLLDGVRPGQPRGAPGVVACQSPLTDWPLPDCFVLGVRQGPDNAGRVWLQIPDQCLFTG